jgi:hypothetical protein
MRKRIRKEVNTKVAENQKKGQSYITREEGAILEAVEEADQLAQAIEDKAGMNTKFNE